MDNAIKHSPYSGSIKIEVKTKSQAKENPTVEINIIDSGSGFAESELPLVFKRLYRGDPSRTRQSLSRHAQGSGLGLAIVEEIIAAHQGQVQAKNHPETGGGWLQIILPINK